MALVVFRLQVDRCSASISSISLGERTRTGVRAERSAIPAKDDCGLSEPDIEQFYSETQKEGIYRGWWRTETA